MKKILAFLLLFICPLAMAETTYVRGGVLHFFSNPNTTRTQESYQYIADGLLMADEGNIVKVGSWQQLQKELPRHAKVTHYKNGLILPGFIDTHIHYHQLDMIAATSGGDLLTWLNKYTFPFEKKFSNQQYAEETADFFLDELLRNGTTTAMVFATRYQGAVDALFAAAEKKHMRIITGKVVGDRNLPDFLMETSDSAYEETNILIKKWHQKPGTRLLYAITPRFAPTTSVAMFEKIRILKKENPGVYIYTHVSETLPETKWANELFDSKSYLAIYDKYELLGDKTLLAHGVYLTKNELERMHETKTSVAFCPTSNLFLGSGLFNLAKAEKAGVVVGLGTDVGAGTSFSLLQTLNEAYKVLQLQQQNLSAFSGFYLATLGGASALNLEDKLGNFKPGKEADFVVLNLQGATPLLKRRLAKALTLEDKLFVLMTLGDDRSIVGTYVNGRKVSS
jgi:guanine deaminase